MEEHYCPALFIILTLYENFTQQEYMDTGGYTTTLKQLIQINLILKCPEFLSSVC